MSASDDYPAMAFTVRQGEQWARMCDEIDTLRTINEDGKRAYSQLLVRYDEQETYLADVARQLADCLVRGRIA